MASDYDRSAFIEPLSSRPNLEMQHKRAKDLLLAHASPAKQLLAACARSDRAAAERIVAAYPDLVSRLEAGQMRAISDRAFAGDAAGVSLMLDLGFDPRVPGWDHGDALHWAGFHGNVDMLRALLRHNPAVDTPDARYGATDPGCIYGAVYGWMRATGNHPESARLLLEAGERLEPSALPTGRDDLDAVLRAHLRKTTSG